MFKLNKEVLNNLSKEDTYNIDSFIADSRRYIKAVQSGRILYTVRHVSNSGMSRNILIKSYEGTMSKGSYCNYYMFLKILGYKFAYKYDSDIKVSGCGMDMLFATNYNIIHSLYGMKLISEAKCNILAQKV